MTSLSIQYSFVRRIFPLSAAQISAVFTDTAFKVLTVLLLCGTIQNSVYNSISIFFFTAIYLIPAVVLMAPAGYLSDRLPKRYVILLAKIIEMLTLLAALLFFRNPAPQAWLVLTLMGILTCQYIFIQPAIFGVLPGIFHEKELTHANGTICAFSVLGMLAGVFYIFVCTQYGLAVTDILKIMFCVSFAGFLLSIYITRKTSVVQEHRELTYPFSAVFRSCWRGITSPGTVFFAAFGDALFVSLGIAVLVLLGFFGTFLYPDFTLMDRIFFRCAPILGFAAGAYFTGMTFRKKIELGIVPFGALGVAVFFLLAAYVPGSIVQFRIPFQMQINASYGYLSVCCCPWALLWLFLAGFNGGIFVIPLRAFFQQRIAPELRGAAMAAKWVLVYLMLFILNMVYLVLVVGNMKGIHKVLSWNIIWPQISPRLLLTSIGVLMLGITLLTLCKLPEFALRFLFLTLGHIFYRLRINGAANIPERGPALLLANHVSYIDNILISACTSRKIRFLIQEEFYDNPFLHWIVSLTGFIRVPSSGKIKDLNAMIEAVQQALKDGEVVCVFPEGTPSRNGIIGKFSGGFKHMIPEGVQVPLIPVNVGHIWGSVFSYYYGSICFRLPKSFPYFASITFGSPLPPDISAFEVRQKVTELAADDAQLEFPDEHPIHYFLGRHAKHHPFQVIMRDAADGKSFTYFKTYLAAILFSRLIRKKVNADAKYVGVLLPNCTTAVISLMGVLLADRVPCPLNFTTSQEILEISIKKAKIQLVLTSRLFLTKVHLTPTPEMVFLEDIVKTIPLWEKIMVLLGIIFIPYKELLNMVAPLTYNDNSGEAVLLFSSGTTGIPKGVMLTHHNLSASIYAEIQALAFNRKKDCMFGNLPLFHSFGMNTCCWLPLIMRSHPMIYVHSPLDAKLIGESIVKYNVPILVATPSFLQTYLRKFQPEVFDTLRLVVSGAEKLRPDVAEKFNEAVNGKLEIVEGYGCTELAPSVAFNMALFGRDTGKHCGKKGSIGQGLETVCIRIMDPLTLKPVPPETEGLLFVKGAMVMQGYLNDPEQTSKVLIDGYYNTGDIAKMDEAGFVTVCGRLSRFSKIAGEMVPHEMVECIINELCGLQNRVVAVSSIPDPQKGEALLVLYTSEMPLTPEQVVAELRERSISNLWIPKACNFEPVESLPILGSGKLDLGLLRKKAEEIAIKRNLIHTTTI